MRIIILLAYTLVCLYLVALVSALVVGALVAH